ncbi:MAG: helix-turn-helix transcriptional regulator [Coriobacteriales bacterium]|nr:helix-turn-helix transcriptional regulator [Coriobacteriales bacterium]
MDDRTNRDFGHLIRRIRRVNGVSQSEIANKMKVSQTRISRLESGRLDPYLFEMVEYSYHIGSGPSAIMKEAARIWGKHNDKVLGKDANPELLLNHTHAFPIQYVHSPYNQEWGGWFSELDW